MAGGGRTRSSDLRPPPRAGRVPGAPPAPCGRGPALRLALWVPRRPLTRRVPQSPFPFRSAGRLLSHLSAERLADFGLAFSARWLILRLGLDSWDCPVPRGTQGHPCCFPASSGAGRSRHGPWCPNLCAPGSRLDLGLPSLWPVSLPVLGGRARLAPWNTSGCPRRSGLRFGPLSGVLLSYSWGPLPPPIPHCRFLF